VARRLLRFAINGSAALSLLAALLAAALWTAASLQPPVATADLWTTGGGTAITARRPHGPVSLFPQPHPPG
jgi:hypothetical protein